MAILREIQVFLDRSGMPVTKFGRLSVNDPRLVLDLRRGREPGKRVRDRIAAFIASQSDRT